jgi:AAA domain/Bifunctional DNA primase/polymerase, N-terminal
MFDPVEYSHHLEDALGIPPLVRTRGKGPFEENWSRGPLEQPDKWREKLRGWTGNLALITGDHLIGVDADLYMEGALGSWDALQDRGFTPYTVTNLSGGGGRHYLYRPIPEASIPSRALPDYPGIQIKGMGGALVVPPSVHPDTGVAYEWEYAWGPFDTQPVQLDLVQCELLGAGTRGKGESRLLDERDEQAVQILTEKFDGHHPHQKAHTIEVTRPGKQTGVSAEIGYFGPGVVKVWSSNWPGLPEGVYELWKLRRLAGIPSKKYDIPLQRRTTPNLTELLDSMEPEYEWRVPHLLERGDRVVLTGKEGYGKSTLLRQIGLGAAMGLNTLSTDILNRHHTPLRVLLIDLENSLRQLRREFRKQLRAADDEHQTEMRARFFVESHPEGLVLNDTRDRDKDRAWLLEIVEATEPDILILGPIYKMIDGDPSDEQPNRDLVKWLDSVRIAYDLVLLLEAHTPHNAVRPYGWSGWKRWPEFGIHLHQDGRLEHWRAMREERPWPTHLARGGEENWLWVPSTGPSEPTIDKHESGVIDRQVDVIRCLHEVGRPLSRNEITDWLGRRQSEVRAAIARLQERHAFIITTEKRMVGGSDRFYPVELFALDPDGPFGTSP